MKHWYVYKIVFSDNKFYIGYRGSKQLPEEDFLIKYFSSSKEVKRKIEHRTSYVGMILEVHPDKECAYNKEQELIYEEIDNPDILNKFCYKDRKGWGLLTESGKQSISLSSKKRWEDPEYRTRLAETHRNRWTDELRERQSTRLTGKLRPDHSVKMSGRKNPKLSAATKGVPKPVDFGKKISDALSGVPKSEDHRKKLCGAKPRICRLTDRKELSVNHYTRWLLSLLPQEI